MGKEGPVGSGSHRQASDCEVCTRLREGLLAELARTPIDLVTPRRVALRAGVPAAEFASHYASLDACLEDAYADVDEQIRAVFAAALEEEGDWRERLACAFVSSYQAVEERPGVVQIYDAARTGPIRLQERRERDRRRYVRMVARRAPEVPEVRIEFLVGAMYRSAQEIIHDDDEGVDSMRRRALEVMELLDPVPA